MEDTEGVGQRDDQGSTDPPEVLMVGHDVKIIRDPWGYKPDEFRMKQKHHLGEYQSGRQLCFIEWLR